MLLSNVQRGEFDPLCTFGNQSIFQYPLYKAKSKEGPDWQLLNTDFLSRKRTQTRLVSYAKMS